MKYKGIRDHPWGRAYQRKTLLSIPWPCYLPWLPASWETQKTAFGSVICSIAGISGSVVVLSFQTTVGCKIIMTNTANVTRLSALFILAIVHSKYFAVSDWLQSPGLLRRLVQPTRYHTLVGLTYVVGGNNICAHSFSIAWRDLYPQRVPNRFFGIRDFSYLKLGIRDFRAKSGPDSGLKACSGEGCQK